MAGVLDSVNQRTQLVGQNRLELLLFRLRGRQMYGINVSHLGPEALFQPLQLGCDLVPCQILTRPTRSGICEHQELRE